MGFLFGETKMAIEQAKTYLNSIRASTIYAGIGKVGAWNVADVVDPTAVDAPDSIIQDMNDAILLKKTYPGQFTLAAVRYEWEENTVYTEWNGSDQTISEKKFYCINDNGIVYKCISNNGGKPSTEMPDSTTPERFTTSDGYVWKLIAVVPEPIALMFNNSAYIPVTTLTEASPEYAVQYASQMSAVAGTIDRIDVVQPGKKYSDQTIVRITGDGYGAKAEVVRHAITGEIERINVTEGGYGYQFVVVEIVDPANLHGEGALAVAIVAPPGGHGSDPESELFATKIIGAFELQGTEEGFIDGNFDYRKIFLVSGLKQKEISVLEVSPRTGYTFINPTETFKFWIKSNKQAFNLKLKTTNAVVGTIDLIASQSDPYNGKEEEFTEKGISVAYDPVENMWQIDFGTILNPAIQASGITLYAQIADTDGNPIFGNVDAPLVGNTFEYEFTPDNTVTNDPQDIFTRDITIDDPRYEYTVKLTLKDPSGTFVMGEPVTFINGGSATVVFIGTDYIKVSSPVAVMTGKINGTISGANANVSKIEGRSFAPNGTAVYQHYLDKHTKLSDKNLKIVPIFEF